MEKESEEVVGERGNLSTGRIAVLFTAEQMQRLTGWMQAVRQMEGVEGEVRGELERLLFYNHCHKLCQGEWCEG